MELSWLQSLVLGLVSGLTDVLPVSSQAHQTLLLTFFGEKQMHPALRLSIHAAIVMALLISCWGHIRRIRRQVRIARLPKRRRTRAVDMAALLDSRIIQTSLWTIVPALVLYSVTSRLQGRLFWLAVFSLVNAVILYLPGLFPTADKDSRLVTPGESLLMGIGTGAAMLPGISSVGACYSIGMLHGIDRTYLVHLSVLMHVVYTFGLAVHDALDLLTAGAAGMSSSLLLTCAIAAAAAALGTILGVRGLTRAASKSGLTRFSFYSFGVALLSFIIYLIF